MGEKKKDDFEAMVEDIQGQIEAWEEAVYSTKVLQEYRGPKNVGRMMEPDAFGIITGPCGDTMEIYLEIIDRKVAEVLFMTDGCGATIVWEHADPID